MPILLLFRSILLWVFLAGPVAQAQPAAKTITLGEQPLYLPSSLIIAAVRADQTLQRQLQQAGVSIRWKPFLSGEPLIQAYRENQIRGGVAGDMPVLRLAADHRLEIPITVQQGFTSLVTNRPMRLNDLKGTRIGVIWGSNAHYTVLSAIEEAGFTEEDVELVPLQLSQLLAVYKSGQIDGFSAWEPALSLVAQGRRPTFSLYRKLSSGYFFFDHRLLKKHPKAMQALVKAFERAIKTLESDSRNLRKMAQQAREHARQLYGDPMVRLDIDQIMHLTQADLLLFRTGGQIPQELLEDGGTLEREFKFLQSRGLIKPDAQWAAVKSSFHVGRP